MRSQSILYKEMIAQAGRYLKTAKFRKATEMRMRIDNQAAENAAHDVAAKVMTEVFNKIKKDENFRGRIKNNLEGYICRVLSLRLFSHFFRGSNDAGLVKLPRKSGLTDGVAYAEPDVFAVQNTYASPESILLTKELISANKDKIADILEIEPAIAERFAAEELWELATWTMAA